MENIHKMTTLLKVSSGSGGQRRESNGRNRSKDPCLGKVALGKLQHDDKEEDGDDFYDNDDDYDDYDDDDSDDIIKTS